MQDHIYKCHAQSSYSIVKVNINDVMNKWLCGTNQWLKKLFQSAVKCEYDLWPFAIRPGQPGFFRGKPKFDSDSKARII